MAVYLGIHDMGQAVPEDQMKSSWEAYKAACDKHSCTAIRAHIAAGQGKAFCLTEASSSDEVHAAHDEAGVPIKEILEVQIVD
jgi:hypothetical protein